MTFHKDRTNETHYYLAFRQRNYYQLADYLTSILKWKHVSNHHGITSYRSRVIEGGSQPIEDSDEPDHGNPTSNVKE